MIIPNKPFKVKVGSQVFDVSYKDELASPYGRTNLLESKITLYKPTNNSYQALENTLLHEIFHCVFREANIDDKDDYTNEHMVALFANVWQQVLNDNPKLFQTKK